MTSFEFYCIVFFFGLMTFGGNGMSNQTFLPRTTLPYTYTQDRFLKSRGVIRGRYAYATWTTRMVIY
jgi:hypothetical protein